MEPESWALSRVGPRQSHWQEPKAVDASVCHVVLELCQPVLLASSLLAMPMYNLSFTTYD